MTQVLTKPRINAPSLITIPLLSFAFFLQRWRSSDINAKSTFFFQAMLNQHGH